MPHDSFQLKYFQHLNRYLNIGPPVYFVVTEGLDFSDRGTQNMICGTRFCRSDSLAMQLYSGEYIPSGLYYICSENTYLFLQKRGRNTGKSSLLSYKYTGGKVVWKSITNVQLYGNCFNCIFFILDIVLYTVVGNRPLSSRGKHSTYNIHLRRFLIPPHKSGFIHNINHNATPVSASRSPNESYIAQSPNSWLDDFFDWSSVSTCCKSFPANNSFCPNDRPCEYTDIIKWWMLYTYYKESIA